MERTLVMAGSGVEWARPMPGLRIVRRGATPIERVQLYGQRCSGTHFAAATLRNNMPAVTQTESYGFKHWFVPRQSLFDPATLVLVVVRDAFDWARSLHRQPWHAHPDIKALDFAGFIRAEWVSVWDEQCYGIAPDHPMLGREMMHERCQDTGVRFANCIAKRTAKLRQWTGLWQRAHNVALLSYDTLRRDPAGVVDAIGAATGLSVAPAFVATDTYKGHGIRPFVAQRYAALAPDDAAHIATYLDPAVEALFDLPAVHVADDAAAA